VERANRVALTAFRALLSEFRLSEKYWPQLVGLVQLSMNSAPRSSLGGHAPMKVFHGREAPDPLDVIKAGPVTRVRVRNPDPESVMKHVRDMAEVCDALHKEVDEAVAKSRAPKDSEGRPVDFDIGQYVLVSYARSGTRSKLKASWGGPQQVVGTVSPFVYQVKCLISGKLDTVHVERLRRYHDGSLNVTTDLLDQIRHDGHGYEVAELVAHRKVASGWELKVRWLGYEEADATFEPIIQLYKDVPAMVRGYVRTLPATPKGQLVKAIRKHFPSFKLHPGSDDE
jgi:hypothetical protein